MVRRRNRLLTDALREVWKTRSRFLSLFVLSALAVAFLSGLRTTSPDMQYTADRYFDAQKLMDVRVLSTQGLSQEDVDALAALDGVEAAEGARAFDVVCGERILSVMSLPQEVNLLALRAGRLPEAADECVAEQGFLDAAGLKLGDRVTVDLAASRREGDLAGDAFTVVGVADSPMYISVDRGSSSLGAGRVNAILVVADSAFTIDYYTAAYLTLEGAAGLDCYCDEYTLLVDGFIDRQEDFARERAQLRFQSLTAVAREELEEGWARYRDAEEEAGRELAQAEEELARAREELDNGAAALAAGRGQLRRESARGEEELALAYARLQEAIGRHAEGQAQLEQGARELEDALARLEEEQALLDGRRAQLTEAQAVLDGQRAELEAGMAQYQGALGAYPTGSPEYAAAQAALAERKAQLDAGFAQVEAAQAQLDGSLAQLEAGQVQLDGARAELEAGRAQLEQTRAALDEAWAEITRGQEEYRVGQTRLDASIAQGEARLDASARELADGEAAYADGLAEYASARERARQELADALAELEEAQREIDGLEPGEWYVLGRNTLSGYVTYGADSARMSNLAQVFPLVFFLVAALVCLTTMTRMVEEQRTQIGSLKALGFTRGAISIKYIGYAFAASFSGGLTGAALGCVLIPLVIYNAWGIMYTLPPMSFLLQPGVGAVAVAAAVACTTGASLAACLSTLTAVPAQLMRPRAPKTGRRVLLERMGFLWRRLSFGQKVTMRNLFRYKRRFWMTVAGIGGCTALIVTGFGIHNSIFDILTLQYDEITPYDASVALADGVTREELEEVVLCLEGDQYVSGWLTGYQSRVDVTGADRVVEGVNLFVVDDMEAFSQFVRLRSRTTGQAAQLPEDGVLITEKLRELLQTGAGDALTIGGEHRVDAPVAGVVENYVYHYIYMTQGCYARLFGEQPVHNTVMLNFTKDTDQVSDELSTALMKLDGVSAYTHIAYIRDSFTDSMASIDYAVVIIILSAAALAFVVLYNLTNINITERMRELATLKVLGFTDGEVSAYVYRENVLLTVLGIALGLVLGRFLHAWLILTVEIDMVMFGRTAAPGSYLWAAVLTAVFSVAVNIAAHYSLKRIDMVESLKTVE